VIANAKNGVRPHFSLRKNMEIFAKDVLPALKGQE
jgi:hypothetical protein